jgi:inner membrane protein
MPQNQHLTDIMDFRLLVSAVADSARRSKSKARRNRLDFSFMPSPVAHGLAGALIGWSVAPPPETDRPSALRRVILFAAAGMAADLDLLVGAHSGPSHGLGAAVIAGVVLWVSLRSCGMHGSARLGIATGLAYATHTLLDWLGTDSSPPIGIMALWPFSRNYYESPWHIFLAISRRYWLPEFWTSNLRALARELLILVPLTTIVLVMRRGRRVLAR